jgi:hypothetical protein
MARLGREDDVGFWGEDGEGWRKGKTGFPRHSHRYLPINLMRYGSLSVTSWIPDLIDRLERVGIIEAVPMRAYSQGGEIVS